MADYFTHFVGYSYPGYNRNYAKNALDRLIGMSLGGIITTFCLIAIAVGTGGSIYIDVAMVVAFLSFAGAVAFSRFLERWL